VFGILNFQLWKNWGPLDNISYSIDEFEQIFEASAKSILNSKSLVPKIQDAILCLIDCIEHGNKIVLFGNGGSAADAQHMAAEFIGRYLLERQSIPAISLTTDSSILTALGNDYSFDDVFSRQCQSIVKEGDVVIAITTSGKSPNIVNGINTSKLNGANIITLTGGNGGSVSDISDISIIVPSFETPRIQEVHRTIIHIICEYVEKNFKV